MINIQTSRVYIPHPTGWTRSGRTIGIFTGGYDKELYNFYRSGAVVPDDIGEMRNFYNVLSAAYNIDLSTVPSVYPYVQYINFMRPRGGILVNNTHAAEYLKKHCCTLIIPDDAEREYVENLYLNIAQKAGGASICNVPSRFRGIVR